MIIGTAGHIDHGKTRLVQALTGIDTDRLQEEKERGITIDLGFAYTPLPSGAVLGFVDVPGHERFVHTMIAGAASIDFFLLVVAADDGVMPQTVEHLQILDLLGIREGLVVLTKEDLVDSERLQEAKEEVRSALSGTGLANVDILAVSARTGRGIDALLGRLKAEAETRPERVKRGAFRLAVDRAFSLPGAGTIATGTVVSGTVTAGDRLVVVPGGLEARVRSVHAQGQAAPMASAGQRCALNLRGPGVTKDRIHRGNCLVDPALVRVSDRFDARIRLLRSEGRPLGQWSPVYLHLGTTAITARVVPLRERPLNPGESGFVQIVPQQPMLVCNGDRFILRDVGATRTIAGGIALDPRPPVRRRRTPERLAVLKALEPRTRSAALLGLLALPPGYVDLGAFAVDWSLTHAEVDGLAREIQAARGRRQWNALCARTRCHGARP